MAGTLRRRAVLAGLGGGLVLGATGGSHGRAAPPLTRGVNIPDWLDRGAAPATTTLAALHEQGFDSIRLPIPTEGLLADATSRRAALHAVATAIAQLERAGLSATIDLHPSGRLLGDFERTPTAAMDEVAAAWSALAPLLAGLPETSAAELLNEPPLRADQWLPLRDRLAAIVRAAAPLHPIVWGASRFQTIGETIGSAPLADANAIVAVHYYAPMGFTHQCASWDGSIYGRFANLPFPADPAGPAVAALREKLWVAGDIEALAGLDAELARPWTIARIDADFARLAAWVLPLGARVIVNEFGVLDFCADRRSRRIWLGAVRRAAERHGFGWQVWELDHGFGIMGGRTDPASFDLGVIDALTGLA